MEEQKNLVQNNSYVKDLIMKMNILSNGLINERKKSALLQKKNEELQKQYEIKENECLELNKKIKDLESFKKKFSQNNTNTNNNEITNNDKINNEIIIQKFADEISSLKLENEDLKLKLNNSMTNLDNKIKQYSKIIEVQTEKLTKKETENMELKKNIFELNEKINNNSNISKEEIENLKKEKNHFEILFKQTENEKKEIKNKYEESLNNIKNLEEEKKNNLEKIHQQEINGIKLAQKLTEYKNLLIELNTKIQIFHVQRINTFTKSEMDITFGQDKNNNFVMKIDDGDSASLVNIEDIESVKQLDKNKLEIKYMFNSKKYKINIIVDELIIDQFITAYNDFYLRSVKEKNNIKY
jgi:hypothetical protein